MNHHPFRACLPCALALVALSGVSLSAHAANDYPTVDRVRYVQECMKANPGPQFEMVNKCSCALDALAAEVEFEEFTTMQTISNGMSIGGERGATLRDTPTLQPALKKYRELQIKVKKGCFINDPK